MDPEVIAYRNAVERAGLERDDVREASIVRDDRGRIAKWNIILQTGRRYKLTPDGRYSAQ